GLGLEHLNKPAPVIPSQLTSSTLRTTQFQTDIFCLRERDLLHRFVTEVSQHQAAQGVKSKEHIFSVTYQIAEDLGRAFSDRLILQTYLDVEATVPAGPLKDILGLMRAMYTTIVMEEDASFLRYGHLSTDNAAVVRKEVPKLCSELRPHALALVSSLGIPDAFLAPIAFNWVEANATFFGVIIWVMVALLFYRESCKRVGASIELDTSSFEGQEGPESLATLLVTRSSCLWLLTSLANELELLSSLTPARLRAERARIACNPTS
ncbi:acyl-coenzyme A oxidase 3, peroxisomal-like protein, partial [Tanacetum coccineum]